MEEKIVYFEIAGKHNTEETLKLAKERAVKRKIKNVIIGSSGGFSAGKALEIFKGTGIKLTIVAHGNNEKNRVPEPLKEQLKKEGHNLCLSGNYKYELPSLAILTSRRFCEGTKVAIEVMMVAVEAGVIPAGQEVISIGGTGPLNYERGGGIDTAYVIEATRSSDFFKLEDTPEFPKDERRKIKEIICKPR